MLRSLFTGVSGVKAHQTKLDVVGNNIANVNTSGFKKSTTVFQDLLSQTTSGAMAPDGNRGGVNASQVGLGVKVGAIETIHTQGPVSFTGNPTDMAIQGDGYFLVKNGAETYYTRAGNMTKDPNNSLVMSGTGYTLQGYKVTVDPNDPTKTIVDTNLSSINVPLGQKLEAQETGIVGYRCNLDSRSKDYLPMGMSSGDREITASLGGKDVPVKITEGPCVDCFSNFEFENTDGTKVSLKLKIVGVDSTNGRPVLEVVPPAPAPGTVDINGVEYKPVYDSDSGLLNLSGPASSDDKWQVNLFEMMDYQSFEVEDGSTPPKTYKCLAEFNDDPDTGSRTMKIWTSDGSTTPPTVAVSDLQKNSAATTPVSSFAAKADGTFDLPTSIPTAAEIAAGADQYTFTIGTDAVGPPVLKSKVFDVLTSADGKTVRIEDSGKQIASVSQRTSSVHVTKNTIYDTQGNNHTLETSWEKVDDNNWRWRVWTEGEDIVISPDTGIIKFNADGKIDTTTPSKIDVAVGFGALGVENQNITLDFSGESFDKDTIEGVTQYGSEFTTKAYYQDGYRMGVLKDFSVSADGTVVGIYDNEQNRAIYRVALATFSNPQGLVKAGDTCFEKSANSGEAMVTSPMTGGTGSIAGGALEMSNVDLTDEFTQLIISQRGFQASSRVITTSDQVLEELLNLKR